MCLAVFLKEDHINGSPFVVSVHKEIKYDGGSKKHILGLDADGPGQFTCPYGVAISPLTGDIWVTDSGNEQDQIQVSDGGGGGGGGDDGGGDGGDGGDGDGGDGGDGGGGDDDGE